MMVPNVIMTNSMCMLDTAHISGRIRLRKSSLSPMVNSRSVMPRSASESSPANDSTPVAFMMNPAIRKPIRGGRLSCLAISPRAKIKVINAVTLWLMAIQVKSNVVSVVIQSDYGVLGIQNIRGKKLKGSVKLPHPAIAPYLRPVGNI